MRIISFTLFIGLFVGLPFYLLNYCVLPALDSMQYSYAHFDETAQAIAGQAH